MNKILSIVFIQLLAAVLFSSCTEENEEVTDSQSSVSSETSQTVSEVTEGQPEPFSEYTFEMRGAAENYMLILRHGEFDDELSVTIENNRYESKEFVITAPSGYNVVYPYDQENASQIVNVIKNDIDDTYIPDIMQVNFAISESELDNSPENTLYNISRMYMIDSDGELREIAVVDGEDEEETVSDYLDRTSFYHTEPARFIYEITVDDTNLYNENGGLRPVEERVTIRTMTFEPEKLRIVMGFEEITEADPLYFGYAYWAAANLAAQNFTVSAFNISDFDNYIEEKNDDETSVYYFKIDDPRFDSTDDLITYLETVFAPTTAQRIFTEAPQKYKDIDGELYGIAGDGIYDRTLGTLTFSGMEITDSRMLFRSRQEKYDEYGNFTGYTDGGNFVIAKQEDGSWKVIQYRYPYSYN